MRIVPGFIAQKYSRQGLLSLFLTCVFPLHVWALIMVFRDVSWIAARTNAWDALGVASYAMVFALTESVLLFLLAALMGFLIPRGWQPDRRIAFLGLLVLILSLWGMISQLLSLWNVSLPAQIIQFLRSSGHPVRFLYAGWLAIVTPTVLLPVYLFIKSGKAVAFMQNVMERLALLAALYLVFDLLGLIIVVIRNIN
jgi:hypothetical protein